MCDSGDSFCPPQYYNSGSGCWPADFKPLALWRHKAARGISLCWGLRSLWCGFSVLLIVFQRFTMPRVKGVGYSRLKVKCGHENCGYSGVQYSMKRHTAARHPGQDVKIMGDMDKLLHVVRVLKWIMHYA